MLLTGWGDGDRALAAGGEEGECSQVLSALLSSANANGPLCDLGPLKAGQRELNSA